MLLQNIKSKLVHYVYVPATCLTLRLLLSLSLSGTGIDTFMAVITLFIIQD